MSNDVNPYMEQGVRELQQQAQIAARHARNAATSAALARVLAKGDLVSDLDKLAADLTEGSDKQSLVDWPKKLRNHAERIRVALGKVSQIGQG